uniref:beta-mannosidase n=3 Tax=Cacopsylla melanoneura TaxID=428564 RepID=A0A8D8RNN4_9HEMI
MSVCYVIMNSFPYIQMMRIIFVLFISSCLSLYSCLTLDLSKSETTVTNSNKSIHIPASIPGGIYSDLISAKVIPQDDIFYRYNDVELRWVGHDDWTYTINITLTEEYLTTQHQDLVLSGVDTIASITLNDHYIGNTSNMFVEYSFNVKPFLQLQNSLVIVIYSPIRLAQSVSLSLPHNVPPLCNPDTYHGECHINVLRKMQASFAWDWGPAFPSMGLWKPVYIYCYDDDVSLHSVSTHVLEAEDEWIVHIQAFVHTTMETRQATREVKVESVLELETRVLRQTKSHPQVERDAVEQGVLVVKGEMRVKKSLVKLWWPNGYGSQPLYNLEVILNHMNKKQSKSVAIGFRTIRIVQDPVPNKKGLTFYFLVNNVPIFAKGSNFIPSHILPEKSADYVTINRLLHSAMLTHTNMIRVWGGGLYESDMFYQLCDRYGILVWQDMMFACATYPATDDFLHSVSLEISQQVRRLKTHASIAVWAGNNENEVALRQNWYSTDKNQSLYFEEYRKLYVDVIRTVVNKEDPSREYLTSSPSNGKESEKENFIANNPYDPLYGDTHNYNYLVDSWDPASFYPVPRFCSEYGFQSLPSHSSLASIATREDLDSLKTPLMTHRQHLSMGNFYLVLLIERQMAIDLNLNDNLKTVIYYSQISQAMSIKTETEVYRRHRSVLSDDGIGLTMGALYWQLNDVWQAPSWSSIEFSGRWKMLHFYAAKFFAPVIISPTLDFISKNSPSSNFPSFSNRPSSNSSSNKSPSRKFSSKKSPSLSFPSKELTLTLVNDLETNIVDNLMIHVSVYTWNSTTPIRHLSKPYTLKKACSEVAWTLPMDDLAKGYSFEEILIRASVTDSTNIPLLHDNYLFPSSLKRAVRFMKPAKVAILSVKLSSKDQYLVHLQSSSIALFVWLELEGLDVDERLVYFSDNGFHMVTEDHIITITAPNVTSQLINDHLQIQVFNNFKT